MPGNAPSSTARCCRLLPKHLGRNRAQEIVQKHCRSYQEASPTPHKSRELGQQVKGEIFSLQKKAVGAKKPPRALSGTPYREAALTKGLCTPEVRDKQTVPGGLISLGGVCSRALEFSGGLLGVI